MLKCCCQFNPDIEHEDVVLASNCCPIHNYNPVECLADPKCCNYELIVDKRIKDYLDLILETQKQISTMAGIPQDRQSKPEERNMHYRFHNIKQNTTMEQNHSWKQYRRKGLSEMRPYILGEDLSQMTVTKEDDPVTDMGMVARNPKNHNDQWYVSKKYFDENLEEATIKNEVLTTFYDRVLKEREELHNRIHKLADFLSSVMVDHIDPKQLELLKLQSAVMVKYSDILAERLMLLNESHITKA